MIDSRLDIPLSALCASMREVAEHCGVGVARNLVYYWPGCRYYVPKKWHPGHELNVLGEAEARCLFAAFGGTGIEIPTRLYSREGLAMMVPELRAKGMSQRDIALFLGIAQKTIRDISSGRQPRSTGTRQLQPDFDF